MVHRDTNSLIGHPPMVEGSPKEINKGDVAESLCVCIGGGRVTEVEWTRQAVFRTEPASEKVGRGTFLEEEQLWQQEFGLLENQFKGQGDCGIHRAIPRVRRNLCKTHKE